VFLVQRTDACCLRPNDRVDPAFGTELRRAVAQGVETYAWCSRLNEATRTIELASALPIDLSQPDLL
jgi:DNA-binding sugar fermentation-stimulating protein